MLLNCKVSGRVPVPDSYTGSLVRVVPVFIVHVSLHYYETGVAYKLVLCLAKEVVHAFLFMVR